jgi:hypothetical protein
MMERPASEGDLQAGIGCTGIVPSYRDFACYYGAEWIKRGIGLYFDNAFPSRAYDPLTTAAYRAPNGQIQPSAGMWARREYLRRVWTMHRTLAPADALPAMMIHMTNTHILPYMVWNDENLDLEWKFGPEPQQNVVEAAGTLSLAPLPLAVGVMAEPGRQRQRSGRPDGATRFLWPRQMLQKRLRRGPLLPGVERLKRARMRLLQPLVVCGRVVEEEHQILVDSQLARPAGAANGSHRVNRDGDRVVSTLSHGDLADSNGARLALGRDIPRFAPNAEHVIAPRST